MGRGSRHSSLHRNPGAHHLVAEHLDEGGAEGGAPQGDDAVGVAQLHDGVPGVLAHAVAGTHPRAVLRHYLPRARVLHVPQGGTKSGSRKPRTPGAMQLCLNHAAPELLVSPRASSWPHDAPAIPAAVAACMHPAN